MQIDPNAGIGTPSAINTRSAQTALSEQGLGKDTFMRLLTTQMQNQDPMNPMDSREMISQLSDLTSVEQLTSISHRLAALEVATAGMANTQVASLVGRHVTADGSSLRLDSTGTASTAYSLDAGAANVEITVRDASGNAVRTISLKKQFAGNHSLTWDGLMDDGSRAPAGRYNLELKAEDAVGRPMNADFDIQGVISGVAYDNGYPELLIGVARVLLGDVQRIDL